MARTRINLTVTIKSRTHGELSFCAMSNGAVYRKIKSNWMCQTYKSGDVRKAATADALMAHARAIARALPAPKRVNRR